MSITNRTRASSLLDWLDSDSAVNDSRLDLPGAPRMEADRWLPFVFLHAGCLLAFWTGCSAFAVGVCAFLYCVRMFAITAFYHRYFSHRAFKTSRLVQLLFALVGASSMQRGPLWWASHHRRHHANSDKVGDLHSPVADDFLWSHIGWLTSSKNMTTDYDRIKDYGRFWELRLINRFDWVMPLLLLATLYAAGEFLKVRYPLVETNGPQLVAWGFFISTTLLFHATCSINSFAHLFGYRSYETLDNSRNNPLLALVTFGEGWHNNHHKFSNCARQGIAWWEVDVTYSILFLMSKCGLVSDLKPLPENRDESPKGQDRDTHADRRAGVM